MSLPQHIHKGVSMRRNITSDLCTTVGCQQFRKNQENVKGELCLNVTIPFSIIVFSLVAA